jgi:hypothetical protein
MLVSSGSGFNTQLRACSQAGFLVFQRRAAAFPTRRVLSSMASYIRYRRRFNDPNFRCVPSQSHIILCAPLRNRVPRSTYTLGKFTATAL